jgi:hypothetical protein
MKRYLPLILLIALQSRAQLPITLTTQEALLPGVSGIARTNEPVTVGLPLPDSAAISSAGQLGCSGSAACQFRWLASWPDGHWKWVLFDYQNSLNAGGLNESVSLTSGGGNVGSNLATDSNQANPDSGTITIDTGTGGCRFIVQKASFDVLHSVVCNGKTLVNGGSAGLVLMGPPFNATPVATCTFNSNCSTPYQSTNDAASQCVIEENGPVRAAVKCVGGLKDASGNKYMGFLLRMHFYLGKQKVKIVSTLKNADDGPQGSFPISYKGYQSFELRLATSLTGSNAWAIGDDTSTPDNGTFTAMGENAYIYQGHASTYLDSGYCVGAPDLASDVARTSSGTACTYAQDGYIVVGPNGKIVDSKGDAVNPDGWADVRDSSGGQGIEIGSEYMAQNFPRSLQIMNSGREVRIGISPDQTLWKGPCTAAVVPCRKIYYQAWPAYKVSNLNLIFHDQDLGTTGESSEFLKMQYHLVARAPIAAYNNAAVFTYPLISANDEDQYMHKVNPRFVPGTLSDMTYKVGCLQSADSCLYMARFYGWATGGDSNQIESRYANLVHRWLARGQTGRYVFANWFVRFQEQSAWPRGDGIRWANHQPASDLTNADGYPSACSENHGTKTKLCSTTGGKYAGMLPNNYQNAFMDFTGSMENNWQHGHWWSLIPYYYLTGDEDANDLLRDGVITEWTATAAKNNIPWTPSGPSYNLLYAARSIGEHLNGAVRYWQYLNDTHGNATDIANVETVVNNNLSVVFGEACTTNAEGNTYPSGCKPSSASSANGPYARGTMAYRGFGMGPGDFDNVNRCAAAPGNKFAIVGSSTRCVKLFMQGLFLDGLWAYAKIMRPASGPDYQRVLDLAYGVASTTDNEMYIPDLVPAGQGYPATGQTVYSISLDQPNDMTWLHTAHESDTFISTPWMNIYMTLGDYTGDTTSWSSHFNNNLNNKGAGASYNPNTITDYGSQQSAAVLSEILNASTKTLQNVTLNATYNSGASQWTLHWTPPAGVTKYLLKENDSKMIVDNVGWNPATDNPIGDAVHDYNWFAASYTANQPPVNASSFRVNAPPTAGFRLKALVTSSSSSGGGLGSSLTITPSSLNFSGATVGIPTPSQTLTLTNAGGSSSSITISGISVSGAFSQNNSCGPLPTSLPVGASCSISLTFTAPQAGQSAGNLSISDNGLNGPTTLVGLAGSASVSSHGGGIPIAPNAWTTFQVNGFPSEIVGYDATVYASAIKRHIVLGKYHHYGSEPNYCMNGWSWDENRWDILDCGEDFHNEHSMEGGHPVGAFVYMPSRKSILYWGGQSGSNQPEIANHTWWWDVVGHVGRDKIGTGQRPGNIKVSAMAYDESRDLTLFYPDEYFNLETYDSNANSWNTPAVNGNPPALEPTFPTLEWNSADQKTYVFGGASGNSCNSESLTFSNDVYTFDPSTNTWALLTVNPDPRHGMPAPRWYAGFAYDPVDNIFLLAGGQNCQGANPVGLTDTWKLDMRTAPPQWTRLTPVSNFILRSSRDAPFQKLRYDADHRGFVMMLPSYDNESFTGGTWGNYPTRIWVYCYKAPCFSVGSASVQYPAPAASLNRNANPITAGNQTWATDTAAAALNDTLYAAWIETGIPFSDAICHFHHPYVQAETGGSAWSRLGSDCTAMDSDAGIFERDAEKLSLAVVNGTLWATWSEANRSVDPHSAIFAKSWNGSAWVGGEIGISNGVAKANQGVSQLGAVGTKPAVAFIQENKSVYPDVGEAYVDQFDGTAWQPLGGKLNVHGATNTGRVESISLTSDGSKPWACWTEYVIAISATNPAPGWSFTNPAQLYCSHWNGSTWSTSTSLNQNSANWAAEAYMTYADGRAYVTWTERSAEGNTQLFVKAWNGSNWSLVGAGALNKNSIEGWVFHPRMATDGQTVYLSWEEAITGEPSALYVSKWSGVAWLALGSTALNVDPVNGTAAHSSITVLDNAPVVIWNEIQTGQLQQTYAKRWTGSEWSLLSGPQS